MNQSPSLEEIKQRLAEKERLKVQGISFTKLPSTLGKQPTATVRDNPIRKTAHERRWELEKMLQKHDLHPLEEMILMLKGESRHEAPLTTDQRIKLLSELASYVVPKMKSVEHSGTLTQHMTLHIMKFDDLPLPEEKVVVPVDAVVKTEDAA